MKYLYFWKIVTLLLLWSAYTSAMGFPTRTEHWSEDALLTDGRVVKVDREVGYTFQFIAGDDASPMLFSSWPDKFGIKFKNPDTKETITWQGEQNYYPVLLDFVDGTPYLVINGSPSKDTESVYGCPELPYIYLKYESGFFGKWSPVPVEKVPSAIRKANLSPYYPSDVLGEVIEAAGGRAFRGMSVADVQRAMKIRPPDAGFFQQIIPRTYREWNYSYKTSYLDERKKGDCRPPRVLSPKVELPTPTEESPEILETINYPPEHDIDWPGQLQFDKKNNTACSKLFRPTDPDDIMQGHRFTKDITGKKPVPYLERAQLKMGVRVICGYDYIWFVDKSVIKLPRKAVITKFTLRGDLVSRVSFLTPNENVFAGDIAISSLRTEDGYLYFDWQYYSDNNAQHPKSYLVQMLKMRMREPVLQ